MDDGARLKLSQRASSQVKASQPKRQSHEILGRVQIAVRFVIVVLVFVFVIKVTKKQRAREPDLTEARRILKRIDSPRPSSCSSSVWKSSSVNIERDKPRNCRGNIVKGVKIGEITATRIAMRLGGDDD